MMNTKILIVEDHAIFREGLKRVIGAMNGVEMIAEAENGAEFLAILKKNKPDIVLMDIKMPVMDGIEATEQAMKLYPKLKIIILTMFGEEEFLYSLIQKGIAGFMLKTANILEIEKAIRMVSEGKQYFSPEINGLLVKRLRQISSNEMESLSARETEVLDLICKGFSTVQIADKLCASKRTIEGYKARLLEKTGQPSTLNLVIFALRNKLVRLED
jgi:DNA-binding NarL/FixJ family response regulator